jgi:beta-lactam-binding protein with PASTA domain
VTATPRCVIPGLIGKKLKTVKKRIKGADCKLGTVTKKEGVTAKTGKVVRQVPQAGKVSAAGSKVTVKLG